MEGDPIRDRRVQYETDGLDVADVDADPIEQWRRWHNDALQAGLVEPNAMTLATVDVRHAPDTRIVLVRGADERGLTFYTNYESAKSRQLDVNPAAAATFGWLELHRQVRVRGHVTRVDEAESDAYFATRPRPSQIGAWASPQSQPIGGRGELDALVEHEAARFTSDQPVPRPAHWGGWRLVPDEWEFWQGRPSRLHDRVHYRLLDGQWHRARLAP